MHPAPSLIVFTVLSGVGLGLMAWLGLGLGPDTGRFPWIGSVLALALTGAGGIASVGHLARPDRAWRAFSQWRSSWLSREACLMAGTVAVFAVYAASWCLWGVRLWGLGLLAAALAGATVYATAMIYGSLKAVPRWSVTPTPQLFLAFAAAAGLAALAAAMAVTGADAPAPWLLPALALAAGVAVWWQAAAAGARRSVEGTTLATATGLGARGRIRLFEPPHTGRNYLLDEMAFKVARRRAWQLRRLGAALGFLLPFLLVLVALAAGDWLLVPAFLSHLAGMLALRWLFFAEAEHIQALYYGEPAL